MKILYITHYTTLYGANKSMLELVKNMKEYYNITPIVITNGIGDINKELNKLGIKNYNYNFYGWVDIKGTPRLKHLLKYIRYKIVNPIVINRIVNKFKDIDIIHSNSSYMDIGYKLAEKLKCKHIWHIREFGEEDYNLIYFSNILTSCKIMESKSDKIIFVSKCLKEKYDKYLNDKRKLIAIYDGVEKLDYYLDISKKDFNSEFNILFTGAIKKEKNQFELIKALELLINKRGLNDIKVYFLGDSDKQYMNEIEAFCCDKGIDKNIFFEGRVEHIEDYVKKCSVGVISSYKEAFGRVTVEYMLGGLAVVASNTGANVELIDNKKNGLIYKLGDIYDLADKIEYLYKRRNVLKDMSLSAQKKALNYYTSELSSKLIYDIYMNLNK